MLSGLIAWHFYSLEGWSWSAITPLGLFVFAILGLADSLTAKIELHPLGLVVVSNFVKRWYVRESIAKVTWARGTPVSLQLSTGKFIRLPGLGDNTQGVANSLQAWLKQSAGAA